MKKKTEMMIKSLRKGNYIENFKIYNKKIDPFGNKVETYKMKSGRTTYWVPKKQK